MASLTCLSCRHIVEVAEGASGGKCENCGADVRPPPPPFTPQSRQEVAFAPPIESSTPPPSAPPGLVAAPEAPRVRAASIVCLVCGLVFFVPFVTQAVGLVAGAIAVFRRRLNNERMAAAWVGIILCLVGLAGWTASIAWFQAVATTGFFTGTGPFAVPQPMAYQNNEWGEPSDWGTEMERVFDAASSYRNDFDRWPASIDDLLGHSLPQGFELSSELTYYPVPPDQMRNFGRFLIVSDVTQFSLEASPLQNPHRVVLRLGGAVEMLPADAVDQLLADQAGAALDEQP